MRSTSELPIRVLTHNIRYATTSPFKGERLWAERRQLMLNELEYHTRYCRESFICLQEVLHNQLEDIRAGLNPAQGSKSQKWAYIGVGRDDGHEAGEYSPIFYRPAVWELLHWETVWLSETPSKPSKSWDAASIRIVTIGVFTHRASGNTVLALNTHLDDQGPRSRLEAARIIRSRIQGYQRGQYGGFISDIFLAGDLNSQENQEAYVDLTGSGDLCDTSKLVDASRRYGNIDTATGFGYGGHSERIDYILLGSEGNQTWRVDGYSVMPNRFDDGVFNSDHRAVVADLTIMG
ncbi:Endonuclease/exonuclease/phosphatase family protein [Penicillium sp. IBT 18751x]|nr:Endonuclease/exonuclease/phosphatase family protein [Penicillium sp. IBT 18751x]